MEQTTRSGLVVVADLDHLGRLAHLGHLVGDHRARDRPVTTEAMTMILVVEILTLVDRFARKAPTQREATHRPEHDKRLPTTRGSSIEDLVRIPSDVRWLRREEESGQILTQPAT